MTFLYTARSIYDKAYDEDGMAWEKYIEWSRLKQLTELISLDGMLNEIPVDPDYDSDYDWENIHVVGKWQTGFFMTVDYVLKRLKAKGKFNFLTVVLEPERECGSIKLDNYEFIGYELLDQDFSISALTNCGGFDETFLPTELNENGLITDFTKAYDIKKQLLENNPYEHHADTNVIAVWRHKTIGR